jgi:hypothetical protein
VTAAGPPVREEETAIRLAGQVAVLWPPDEQVRADLLRRFPPRPVPSSWPATQPSREQLTGLLARHVAALPASSAQHRRHQQLSVVLGWLQGHDGAT